MSLVCSETDELIPYWLNKGLAKKHRSDVERADIVIVPFENFRGIQFAFHQNTPHLFQYIKSGANGFEVEICADDEEYLEVALHGQAIRIGTIIATYVAIPIVVNLLSSYIYDEMKAKPKDTVEVSLIVQDHECKAFKFDFNGNAEEFNKLSDAAGELARKCMSKKSAHHQQ